MKEFDVVLLTEARYINPREVDWYAEQVLTEDRLVQEALERKGLRVIKKSWDDTAFDWTTTRVALFRTTWDYFHRFAEFSEWLDRVSGQTTLINSVEQIRWNMDKHYLTDLKNRGVRVPPTRFIEAGTDTSLAQLHQETGWENTVLKPTFSGAARHTYKLNPENLDEHEAIFQELVANEAMMLQVFQTNVVTRGEVSHMVFGGKYSHSVLKIAKPGDFRVQDDFGGTVHNYSPSPEEIEFAEFVVSVCEPQPAYARVDVIWDNDNRLAVAELELIEPELWFRKNGQAAGLLAETVIKVNKVNKNLAPHAKA